jgi:hypothetical protein
MLKDVVFWNMTSGSLFTLKKETAEQNHVLRIDILPVLTKRNIVSLRCETIYSQRTVVMFRRNTLPPSSGTKASQAAECVPI